MKAFIQKIMLFLTTLFSSASKLINEIVHPTIEFLQALKSVLDTKALDVATALTKTKIDDAMLVTLRGYLNQAIEALKVSEAVANAKDEAERLKLFISFLNDASDDMRDALMHKTASVICKLYADDNKLEFKQADIDLFVQLAYKNLKSNKESLDVVDGDVKKLFEQNKQVNEIFVCPDATIFLDKDQSAADEHCRTNNFAYIIIKRKDVTGEASKPTKKGK